MKCAISKGKNKKWKAWKRKSVGLMLVSADAINKCIIYETISL